MKRILIALTLAAAAATAVFVATAAPRAVFMGNSITEGWLREHPAFFKDHDFVGKGISGQTSSQMLERFKADVVSLSPEIVVINSGTNDIAENGGPYDEDATFGNIVAMAEMASGAGIKVMLSSVLPADKIFWRLTVKDVPAKIKSLNRRIREYANSKGYPFVDYYEMMVEDGDKLNPAYTKDGIHPTPAGYDVMEYVLTRYMDF